MTTNPVFRVFIVALATYNIFVRPVVASWIFQGESCTPQYQEIINADFKRTMTMSQNILSTYLPNYANDLNAILPQGKDPARTVFGTIRQLFGESGGRAWPGDVKIYCDTSRFSNPLNVKGETMVLDRENKVIYPAVPAICGDEGRPPNSDDIKSNVLFHYADGKYDQLTFCPWWLEAIAQDPKLNSVSALLEPLSRYSSFNHPGKFRKWYKWWQQERPTGSNNKADIDVYLPRDIMYVHTFSHLSGAGFRGTMIATPSNKNQAADVFKDFSWQAAQQIARLGADVAATKSMPYFYIALWCFLKYAGLELKSDGMFNQFNGPSRFDPSRSRIPDLGADNVQIGVLPGT
ncbi:hypothetical protein BDR22DRAFT_824099 [Usnea florida]